MKGKNKFMNELRSEIRNLVHETNRGGFVEGAQSYLGFKPPQRARKKKRNRGSRTTVRRKASVATGRVSRNTSSGVTVKRVTQRFDVGNREVCLILPANPMMWYDSDLGGIAKLHQYYRVERLEVAWKPSCSSTTSGTVTIGQLPFGSSILATNLPRELIAGVGGVQGQIWEEFGFKLDKEATDGYHGIRTTFGADNCPFLVYVHRSNTSADLGYVEVNATYRFKGNSIGKCGVMTNDGTDTMTLSSGATTETDWQVNIGSLAMALEDINLGDLSIGPGDIMVCTGIGSTPSTYWRVARQGIITTDSDLACTSKAFIRFSWSRTGGN